MNSEYAGRGYCPFPVNQGYPPVKDFQPTASEGVMGFSGPDKVYAFTIVSGARRRNWILPLP